MFQNSIYIHDLNNGTSNLIGIKGDTSHPNVIPRPYPEIPEITEAKKATATRIKILNKDKFVATSVRLNVSINYLKLIFSNEGFSKKLSVNSVNLD